MPLAATPKEKAENKARAAQMLREEAERAKKKAKTAPKESADMYERWMALSTDIKEAQKAVQSLKNAKSEQQKKDHRRTGR